MVILVNSIHSYSPFKEVGVIYRTKNSSLISPYISALCRRWLYQLEVFYVSTLSLLKKIQNKDWNILCFVNSLILCSIYYLASIFFYESRCIPFSHIKLSLKIENCLKFSLSILYEQYTLSKIILTFHIGLMEGECT